MEIRNSRRPLTPLGLERQRKEMVFFWSPRARVTQKKLELHGACLVRSGATEERPPLLKVLPQAGGLRREGRNTMASSLFLPSRLLPASLFGCTQRKASFHWCLRHVACRGEHSCVTKQGGGKAKNESGGQRVQKQHTYFPFYKVRRIVPTSLIAETV